MTWSEDEQFETTKVSFEQWNVMFGLQSTVLFYLGYKCYEWYPRFVEDNYVERDPTAAPTEDLEWAQSTREITAWTNTAETLLVVQGAYWLIWLANYTLDNQGGALHHLFYIAMKSSQAFPWLLAALAASVNVAYPQSAEVENNDITLAATPNEWKKQYFYYIYTTHGTAIQAYETVQTTRQLYLWVAAFSSQIMNAYAVPALTAKWEMERDAILEEEEAAIAAAKAAAAEK